MRVPTAKSTTFLVNAADKFVVVSIKRDDTAEFAVGVVFDVTTISVCIGRFSVDPVFRVNLGY